MNWSGRFAAAGGAGPGRWRASPLSELPRRRQVPPQLERVELEKVGRLAARHGNTEDAVARATALTGSSNPRAAETSTTKRARKEAEDSSQSAREAAGELRSLLAKTDLVLQKLREEGAREGRGGGRAGAAAAGGGGGGAGQGSGGDASAVGDASASPEGAGGMAGEGEEEGHDGE